MCADEHRSTLCRGSARPSRRRAHDGVALEHLDRHSRPARESRRRPGVVPGAITTVVEGASERRRISAVVRSQRQNPSEDGERAAVARNVKCRTTSRNPVSRYSRQARLSSRTPRASTAGPRVRGGRRGVGAAVVHRDDAPGRSGARAVRSVRSNCRGCTRSGPDSTPSPAFRGGLLLPPLVGGAAIPVGDRDERTGPIGLRRIGTDGTDGSPSRALRVFGPQRRAVGTPSRGGSSWLRRRSTGPPVSGHACRIPTGRRRPASDPGRYRNSRRVRIHEWAHPSLS